MSAPRVRSTRDAYVGLENPSEAAWRDWHRAMLEERAAVLARERIDLSIYEDPETSWSDVCFRQLFVFMYDTSFFDRDAGRYRAHEMLERHRAMFGRIDSVLLWHAYPRLGFDRRTQFDFYRQMPGGLAALREQVSDVLHASGVRVFVDYNPWDTGTYEELADIVAALDADGVMLDTMPDLPEALAQDVRRRKRGVVFAPELRPSDRDLARVRQSWVQWSEVGDASMPSIYRHRWIAPRHAQLAIRRWDTSRRGDIVFSFFNGSGLILWDNVFGTWNPYSREDRRLIAETGAVLDRYADVLVRGEWLPLVPSGRPGLDANRWSLGDRVVVTLRNRTKQALEYRVPHACAAFWGPRRELQPGDTVTVDPEGVQTLVVDETDRTREALEHFDRLSARADVDLPGYDERCPAPRRIAGPVPPTRGLGARTDAPMIELPGGRFVMRVRHLRRECGCYPFGASPDAMWGWDYRDTITHEIQAEVSRFAIRAAPVTCAEFVAFLRASGYRPDDPDHDHANDLSDRDHANDLSFWSDTEAAPVTRVTLADARAFAAWHGQRLPTEAEWHWAAQSGDARITGLSGGPWELTESEYDDGHTRFVVLRGGSPLPPGESEWLPERGRRPLDSHCKYILMGHDLDRSESIGFRTVVDLD